MNIITRIVGGLVRLALAGVMGWLVHKGIIDESQVEMILYGITLGVIAIAWSVANKYGVVKWIRAALGLQAGATPEMLEHVVKREKSKL